MCEHEQFQSGTKKDREIVEKWVSLCTEIASRSKVKAAYKFVYGITKPNLLHVPNTR